MDERRILEDCLRALHDRMGLDVSPITEGKQTGAARADTVVRLTLPIGETIDVCVEVKAQVRPAMLPEIQARLAAYREAGCRAVLVATPYVPEALAHRFRERGLWFVDGLGNAYIEVPGVLLIYSVGKRPARWQPPNAPWMSAQGAKVLFQLLVRGPEIQATLRELAQEARVSLGTTSKTLSRLISEEVITRHARGVYEVVEPRRLLDMWSDAYALKLRPRISLGRFRSLYGTDFARMLEQTGRAGVKDLIVGGEYAADRLTGYLRAGSLNLYVPPDRVRAVQRVLRLAPSAEGNIELYERFANRLEAPRNQKWPPLAHPVLVYAELLATDDPRCGEAALRLKERHLPWIP